MAGQKTNDPMKQIAAEIANIRATAEAALRRPLSLPVLDEDPPEDSPYNIWLMQDGRIRGRFMDSAGTGLVTHEWLPTVPEPGGDVSAEPTPDPPPVYVTQQKEYAATWWRTYRSNGQPRTSDLDRAYQGNSGSSSFNGRMRSLIGFDATAIAADLAGATINNVWLDAVAEHAWYYDGADYFVGAHDLGSAPGTYGGGAAMLTGGLHWPRTGFARNVLGPQLGNMLRDGSASGIALEAPSDSRDFYGALNGASMKLIINYVGPA